MLIMSVTSSGPLIEEYTVNHSMKSSEAFTICSIFYNIKYVICNTHYMYIYMFCKKLCPNIQKWIMYGQYRVHCFGHFGG